MVHGDVNPKEFDKNKYSDLPNDEIPTFMQFKMHFIEVYDRRKNPSGSPSPKAHNHPPRNANQFFLEELATYDESLFYTYLYV